METAPHTRSTSSATSADRRRPFPVGLLAAALVMHLALLVIPIARDVPEPPTDTVIEVALEPIGVPTPTQEPQSQPDPLPPPEPLPPEPVQPPSPAVEPQPASPEQVAEAPADPEPPPPFTAARLLESVSELDWQEPNSPVAIRRSTDSELYARIVRPVMGLEEQWFDDVVLTGETEIKDRWQSAGGVHHVVIRAPNGMTLCGRQEPVNEFRPWEQMPMMFGRCAGGWRKARPSSKWRDSPTP